MNHFSSLTAAALLSIGGLIVVGCQGQNDRENSDNTSAAQTSGDVYRGSHNNSSDTYRSGTTNSDTADQNNEPGRGLSSSDLETHGAPSRITGGENVDHNGLDVPTPQPSDRPLADPATQPSSTISQ
jgi:hypothetical protein